jgi:hypothetical protein
MSAVAEYIGIEDYSAFNHLVGTLHLQDGELMAMLAVYIDDSGTHPSSDIAVAAGFASEVGYWSAFEVEWKAALSAAGILNEGFHSSEFEAQQKPTFSGWSNVKRDTLRGALIKAINDHALVGFAAAVKKSDYDALVQGKLREKLGDHHYTFAVQACLYQIQEWMRYAHYHEPIQYVFDQMSNLKSQNEINTVFHDLHQYGIHGKFGVELGGHSFQSRKAFIPLQAADIIAWESYTYMKRHVYGAQGQRDQFKSLADGVRDGIRGRFYDANTLPDVVADFTARYQARNWTGPNGGFV